MGSRHVTRRQLLAGVGAAGIGLTGVGVTEVLAGDWTLVESPVSKTLYEVVRADDGPYAVGGSGSLIHRSGGSWQTVLSDGPTGNNKTLRGAAVTDDESRVWMCGSSGRLAEYDVSSGEVIDHSKPNGTSPTFYDVAVTGIAGEDERVYATKGSGEVLVGSRGRTGLFEWEYKDTGGSYTVTGVDFHTDKKGRVCTNGHHVFETTDGGRTWTKLGLEEAQNPFNDIVSLENHVYVAADNGLVWRLDCTCMVWTPLQAGTKDVQGLSYRLQEFLGAGASGQVFFPEPEGTWGTQETPSGSVLLSASPGDLDICVGKSGTIVER